MPNMDPEQVRAMAEAFEAAAVVLQEAFEKAEVSSKDWTDGMPKDVEKSMKMSSGIMTKVTDAALTKMEKSYAKTIGTISNKFKALGRLIKKSVTSPFSSFASGALLANKGVDKVHRGVSKFSSAVGGMGLRNIPFGGLIGLMLYGKYQEAEYAAKGQRIAQGFKQVGDVGSKTVGQMTSMNRRLSVMLGTDVTGAIKGVVDGFAGAGFAAEKATQKAGFAIGKGGKQATRSLVETQVALDMLFNTAASPMVAQLAVDTNMSLRESQRLVKDIGLAAGSMGMSFTMASGAITQSTSALRIQGTSARGLADLMQDIQKSYQAIGMSKQRAGKMAAGGVTGVARGMAGMDLGMLGVLSERMDPGTDTLKGAVGLERGIMGGGDPDAMIHAVSEMAQLVSEQTGASEEQYLLFKHFFKGDKEAANAMMGILESSKEDGTSIAQAAEASKERLEGIFNQEAKKQNFFKRQVGIIQDAIARLGVGLIEIMMNGFKQLFLLAQLIKDWAKGGFWEGPGEKALGRFTSESMKTAAYTDAAMNRVGDSLGTILNTAGKMMGHTLGLEDNPAKHLRGGMRALASRLNPAERTGAGGQKVLGSGGGSSKETIPLSQAERVKLRNAAHARHAKLVIINGPPTETVEHPNG